MILKPNIPGWVSSIYPAFARQKKCKQKTPPLQGLDPQSVVTM
jgi:hypothetical protein